MAKTVRFVRFGRGSRGVTERIDQCQNHEKGRFNLAFMRHTGQWVELYDALTVDECLKAIQDDTWFVP